MRLQFSRVILWLKGVLPLRRQARIAARVVPARLRYRFALAASRWQGRVMKQLGRNGALTEALMLDHWIRELTFEGPFPIPWRLHGRETLERYSVPGPVLYYSTHVPLGQIPLSVLSELGYPLPVPIADRGLIVDGERFLVLCTAERVPALSADLHSLARMRTTLQRGTSVSCLMDRDLGGEGQFINPLRLCGRLGVPVLFTWAEMGVDSVIDVTFCPSPHPMCETEEAIAENVKALLEITDRILERFGVAGSAPHAFAKMRRRGGEACVK